MTNETTKWAVGVVLAILIGSVGWVFGLTRPSAVDVKGNEARITTLERRADVVGSDYKYIIDRLDKIDRKLDALK